MQVVFRINFNRFSVLFRFLLYDCDLYTRNYFKDVLKIVQPNPIQVLDPKASEATVYKKVILPTEDFKNIHTWAFRILLL